MIDFNLPQDDFSRHGSRRGIVNKRPQQLQDGVLASCAASRITPKEFPSLLPDQAQPYRAQERPAGEPENLKADKTKPRSKSAPKPLTIADVQKHLWKDSGVWVPPIVRRITRTGDQAILLAQIIYWFRAGKDKRPRARAMRKGVRWLAKRHEDLAKETGLSTRQVRTALSALKKTGLIQVTQHRFSGIKMSHIRPKNEIIIQRVTNALSAKKKAVAVL